jgi:hypothetical protein
MFQPITRQGYTATVAAADGIKKKRLEKGQDFRATVRNPKQLRSLTIINHTNDLI